MYEVTLTLKTKGAYNVFKMKKQFLIIGIFLTFSLGFSQNKNEWFFGAEIGKNTITSYNLGEANNSFQGGIITEYYFTKHWSFVGRLKYFKTGVSFFRNGTSGSFLGSDTKALVFNGAVLSIPVNVKWNYKIFSKLTGNLKVGFAYNLETKSDYLVAYNIDTNNPKSFGNFNTGLGFEYCLNSKTILYIDCETYQLGSYKGNNSGLIITTNYYTTNNQLNIGVKHNFKRS